MSCPEPQNESILPELISLRNATDQSYPGSYQEEPWPFWLSFCLLALQWLIALVGILGNTLVLLTYQNRQEKSPSEVFIVTMAILDTAMCCSIIFFTAFKDVLFPLNCYLFCAIGNFMFDAMNTSSSILTFIICINRFFAVCKPTSYKYLFADGKTILILLICVAGSLLNCPVGLLMCAKFRLDDSMKCGCHEIIHITPEVDVLKLLWVTIRTLMLLANAIAMAYVYPKIFCNMRERSRRMRRLTGAPAYTAVRYCATADKTDKVISVCVLTSGRSSDKENCAPEFDESDSRQNIKAHRDTKLTSTLLTVTIAYVTLMTPDIIVHLIDTFSLLDSNEFDLVRTVTQTLYLLNFVINPFIHYWVNSFFKSELQRRFLSCRHP